LVFTSPDGVISEKHRLSFGDMALAYPPIRTWFKESYEGWAARGQRVV
jgi:hypothetical protein